MDGADANIPAVELKIELIDKYEVTLPPASHPWDWEGRQNQIRDRKRWLEMARVDRGTGRFCGVGCAVPSPADCGGLTRGWP